VCPGLSGEEEEEGSTSALPRSQCRADAAPTGQCLAEAWHGSAFGQSTHAARSAGRTPAWGEPAPGWDRSATAKPTKKFPRTPSRCCSIRSVTAPYSPAWSQPLTIRRLFWVSSDEDFPLPSTAAGSAAAPRSAPGARAASGRAAAAAAFTLGKLLTPENRSPHYNVGARSKPQK